jgi:hypothetical protein
VVGLAKILKKKKKPNTACTGQVRAVAHTFGIQPQTADSASGGFVRQFPPLPVTPAVGPLLFIVQVLGFIFLWVGLEISARKRFPFVGIFQAGTAKFPAFSRWFKRNQVVSLNNWLHLSHSQRVICAIINQQS